MSSIYFSEPANWRKIRQVEYMKKAGQINFHRVAVSEVKDRVSNVCSYLSHLTTKKKIQEEIENEDGEKTLVDRVANRIYFLAHVMKQGEKRIVRFDTGKESADELVAEDYKALKEKIDEYVKS